MPPKKPALSVVPPNAQANTKRPMVEMLKSDDRREVLVAMRDRVATALADPNTPPRDLAALTRRHIEIVRELAAIDAEERLDASEAATPDEEFDASTA